MSARPTRLAGFVVCLCVAAGALPACHHDPGSSSDDPSAPHDSTLPPLVLKDDTPNLLLTWVDDKGDFHVVTKIKDVPDQGKKAVRVVVTNKNAGTGGEVYVANLTKKNPDGSYAVGTMTRGAWDDKGASLRKTRMEALAPSARPPLPAGSASAAPGNDAAFGEVVAIIYGASWCSACHDAERYLKQRGIRVIHKDIEKSEVANNEMERKLAANHLRDGSIPVIDIGGHVMVGFSPSAIDSALAAARQTQTL